MVRRREQVMQQEFPLHLLPLMGFVDVRIPAVACLAAMRAGPISDCIR